MLIVMGTWCCVRSRKVVSNGGQNDYQFNPRIMMVIRLSRSNSRGRVKNIKKK
jgi:hypothetical protein